MGRRRDWPGSCENLSGLALLLQHPHALRFEPDLDVGRAGGPIGGGVQAAPVRREHVPAAGEILVDGPAGLGGDCDPHAGIAGVFAQVLLALVPPPLKARAPVPGGLVAVQPRRRQLEHDPRALPDTRQRPRGCRRRRRWPRQTSGRRG